MLASRSSASERERRHAFRMPQRELLRDHPAHRHSKNMRPRNVELVEHARSVIGKHLDRIWRVRLVALSGSAIVEGDYAKRAREIGYQLGIPSRGTGAETHDHQ